MYGGAGGTDGYKLAHPALNSTSRIASLWKPFLQTLAFERGAKLPDGTLLNPDTVIDAAAYSLNGWKPRVGAGLPASLRVMLASSRADYALFLTERLGLVFTADFFEHLTQQTINEPNDEVSLGLHPQMALSPLKVASLYALFARNGSTSAPTPFHQITLDDRPVLLPARPSQELFKPEPVRLTTEMLRAVAGAGEAGRYGTLRTSFARAGLPIGQITLAAKTGSGPEAVWAVAVSERLVVVAWLGYERSPFLQVEGHGTAELSKQQMTNFKAGETAGILLAEFLKAAFPLIK